MRIYKIFLLHFQEVFEQRGRTFVWVLSSLIGPILMILFWRGAKAIPGWTIAQLTSYYFLVIILGAFIMTHIEERIGKLDILEGQLIMHIIKPFPYFWLKFFYAVPYRIVQGIFGICLFLVFYFSIPHMFSITSDVRIFMLGVLITFGAFFLAFIFKMIVGICAFWVTEARGLYELVNIVLVVFAGYLMPLSLFPTWLHYITNYLPFPYMLYFPIMAFTGKLTIEELMPIFGIQLFWICFFYLLYKKIWHEGLKKFSSVGQ